MRRLQRPVLAPDLDQLAVAITAMQAVLAVEDPRNVSDEDKVGMEVVA